MSLAAGWAVHPATEVLVKSSRLAFEPPVPGATAPAVAFRPWPRTQVSTSNAGRGLAASITATFFPSSERTGEREMAPLPTA